ncbi:hypothetical protein DRF58_03665 [Epilithonimonas hispanica]|uniref:Uncharacterized protein n=1 Tax=Epilithonimonas hispanica TaxID=358687 RepID=A0A3D9D222_9FLAO|nr:hypothetical protein DRF58_03665 [Epilithonimonas hispanica]
MTKVRIVIYTNLEFAPKPQKSQKPFVLFWLIKSSKKMMFNAFSFFELLLLKFLMIKINQNQNSPQQNSLDLCK